ncbi:MAG: hypothetical protein ACPHRO_09815, partial [Nannocystaceae bacterium]
MSEQDDEIMRALHNLRSAEEEAEAALLREVAAGTRDPDTVTAGDLDEDPETQALLLELSAPAGDDFRAALADRVEAQLHAAHEAQAPSNVTSMAAFRRKRAGVIGTLAVAAAAAFLVFRAPAPDDGDDAVGVIDGATLAYSLEVTKAPKTSRGDDEVADTAGAGTAEDPVQLSVPTSGEVEWLLRPERVAETSVDAKVFVQGPDGALIPAGDELAVVVAKTGAVRVTLQL